MLKVCASAWFDSLSQKFPFMFAISDITTHQEAFKISVQNIAKLSLRTDQELNSSIFPCSFIVVRPALVTSPLDDVHDHTHHIFSVTI